MSRLAMAEWAVGVAALVSAWYFVLTPLPRYDWHAAACLATKPFCHVEVNPKWAGGLPGRGEGALTVAARMPASPGRTLAEIDRVAGSGG